jgi:hypothetical protein
MTTHSSKIDYCRLLLLLLRPQNFGNATVASCAYMFSFIIITSHAT